MPPLIDIIAGLTNSIRECDALTDCAHTLESSADTAQSDIVLLRNQLQRAEVLHHLEAQKSLASNITSSVSIRRVQETQTALADLTQTEQGIATAHVPDRATYWQIRRAQGWRRH